MKKLISVLFLAALLCAGLTACNSTSEIVASGLKVQLTKVERATDGSVQVTWRVVNPNVVSYLFSKATLKVALNGTAVGTVADNSPLAVPTAAQVERTGTLVPAGPATGTVIAQALAQGSAAYKVDIAIMVVIVDTDYEKIQLGGTGSVPVTGK